jgi:hypothetical protein
MTPNHPDEALQQTYYRGLGSVNAMPGERVDDDSQRAGKRTPDRQQRDYTDRIILS